MKSESIGVQAIARERQRQIDQEGWSPDHDDTHTREALAWAAVCYAAPTKIYRQHVLDIGPAFHDPWPWAREHDKREPRRADSWGKTEQQVRLRIRELEKAGALVAAEIDRLERLLERAHAGEDDDLSERAYASVDDE